MFRFDPRLLNDRPADSFVPERDVRIRKSIYGNFLFAPISLLVISSLGILFRRNVEYGFNFGVVSFVILIFVIVIALIL